MDLLIVVKWLTDWKGQEGKAPSIISIMINMFLNQGKVDEAIAVPLIGSASTQQSICIILLLIALICIPTMLLVKPIYLNATKKKHGREGSIGHRFTQLDDEEEKDGGFHTAVNSSMKGTMAKVDEEIDLDAILAGQGGNSDHHAFGEMFIHQLIETIEFALGTVSNTASYLRLWALSLAHSQLAHVFYDKLLGSLALSKGGNFFMVFLLFPAFFSFTLFVLLCMDVMECFLHTLRLHWVEFQNKFYKGNGYLFNPFSFEKELKQVK
jgi:V-type H+-transporting ATPase subunit a